VPSDQEERWIAAANGDFGKKAKLKELRRQLNAVVEWVDRQRKAADKKAMKKITALSRKIDKLLGEDVP
jgi:hypothetical protein